MPMNTGFMNIYRSGHFHRKGKPGMFDRHGGDLYPTREAALADIDRSLSAGYVATTDAIVWYEAVQQQANPPSSVPVPMSQTRIRAVPKAGFDSLETSEADAVDLTPEQTKAVARAAIDKFDRRGPSQLAGMRPLRTRLADHVTAFQLRANAVEG